MLIFAQRWFVIIYLIILLIGYLFLMNFRRFLAIVIMPMVFYWMWEGINAGTNFPFFSLMYIHNESFDYYIGNFLPISPIFIKGFIYFANSYIATSIACRKFIDSEIDLVKNRGKRVLEHMFIGIYASIIFTVSMMIAEPVLVAGNEWSFGAYEQFNQNNIFFGVQPLYFFGCFLIGLISYTVIAIIDANVTENKQRVLFDYSEVQSPLKYQFFALVMLVIALLIPSLIMLIIDFKVALIDLCLFLPCIFIAFLALYWITDKLDKRGIDKYCDNNPDSFICDID